MVGALKRWLKSGELLTVLGMLVVLGSADSSVRLEVLLIGVVILLVGLAVGFFDWRRFK